MIMKHLPNDERPYEKCLLTGPKSLTDKELLAVIIRCGIAGENSLEISSRILDLSGSVKGILGLTKLTIPELMTVKGIGKVKAIQIVCIAELAQRIVKTSVEPRVQWNNPEDIAMYYMEELRHLEQEELRVLLLDTKNHLIQSLVLTKGTVNASLISPREIFIEALRYHAVYIILIHNHPSGDANPSREDIKVTRQVRDAGALIGIQLLDHIIIGNHIYISMRNAGYF
jgi:DNA repair protein RadC